MTRRILAAGDYRLDLADERLWRDGAHIALGGRAFALLRLLMERPQTLVTKDEIFDRVWPGLAVSDSVLTTAVKELRRALGDEARRPAVIQTVHGRGYRFMLPVTEADAPAPPVPAPPPPRRRRLVLAALAASILAAVALGLAVGSRLSAPAPDAGEKSLAVLPFEDLSPERDEGWFAAGLTEEVLNTLARAPDLRVVSRTASASFGAHDADAAVGSRTGVAHVLHGAVRRTGDRLRVTVTLARTSDGASIWSKTYDRRERDVISIQEDIAYDLAEALRTVMEPAKLRAMVDAGTRSVEAYEAYLRGLALDQRELEEGDVRLTAAAGEAYEQARALDPGFSAAHWRAARSWFGNVTRLDAGARGGLSDAERLDRYLERMDAAIATSKDDVTRLKHQAQVAPMRLKLREAHRIMARYLEARPRDIDAWEEMGDIAAYAGETEWSARAAERVHAMSMKDGLPRSRAITLAVMSQRYALAARMADEQLGVLPDNALTRYQAHRAYIAAGRIADARALLPGLAASSLPPASQVLARIRQACAEGATREAHALASQMGEAALAIRWQAALTLGDRAAAEAMLRPYDRAEALPTLLQFMIYPTFDARPFPHLTRRLAAEGVRRAPPSETPGACPRA
jgi:TolB-like protein/DNA-binding winged helix-turn-helix (wHTH) protein